MAFHKSIYFKISVPVILAPIFAFLAIWLVEVLGAKTLGEWSGKLTWVCSAALAPVALAISKFRDLCGMDGLTDIQRANLVTIVRKRTLRFWLASLYLIAVFLLGFAVGVTADTPFGYLVAVSWVAGFFFALYLCVFHAHLDADSTKTWTGIPRQTGQGFHDDLDTDSTANWTVK